MSFRDSLRSVAATASAALVAGLLVLNPASPSLPQAAAFAADGSDSEIDYSADFTSGRFIEASGAAVIPEDEIFTVEAWVKPDAHVSGDVYKTIVSQNQDGAGVDDDRFFVALKHRNSQYFLHLACDNGPDFDIWLMGAVNDSGWQHLAVSVNGTAFSVFLNANLISSGNFNYCNIGSSNAPFTVGATGGSATHYFDGQIDQVKVWGEPLSKDELAESMHTLGKPQSSDKTLIAHYDFNEPSGNTSNNRASQALNLTASGSYQRVDVKLETITANGSTLISFPRTYLPGVGGWKVPAALTQQVEVLVLGGGGGGGSSFDFPGAGGGGAGQFLEQSTTLLPGALQRIKVGAGGPANPMPIANEVVLRDSGHDGQGSQLGAISALGGGGGGGRSDAGRDGASGGGAGGRNDRSGGTGLAGNDGGSTSGIGSSGSSNDWRSGAGGGGAGGPGGDSTLTSNAVGAPGPGTLSALLGQVVAAGGAGGPRDNGPDYFTESATANTGNGGNGAQAKNSSTTLSGDGPNVVIPKGAVGGSGGSGLVAILISAEDSRSLTLTQPSVAPGASTTLSGSVSAVAGTFIMSLKASTGSFTIAAGNVASGAVANTGISSVGSIAFSGSATALGATLNKIVYNAPAGDAPVTISALLVPVVPLSYSSVIQDPMTGHLYTVDKSPGRNFNDAVTNASSKTFAGLQGYLATPSTEAENNFLSASAEVATNSGLTTFNTETLWIGLSDADESGNFSATWSWQTGPEAGQAVSIGHNRVGYEQKASIPGVFNSWEASEPNANSQGNSPNCAVTNFSIPPFGEWDDVACTSNVTMPSLIEYGGLPGDVGFTAVNFQVEQPTLDIEFTELDFDYNSSVNIASSVVATSAKCTTNSSVNCVGKNEGDKVLFENVSTRNGVSIDAVVTTVDIPARGRIVDYEVGASAGGPDSFFQVDGVLRDPGTSFKFNFEFFLAGTYGTPSEVQVRLKNVNVTAIDIDATQYNDLTDVDGYTVASNTYMTTCVSSSPITSCASNTPNPTFPDPNYLRFQGRNGTDVNSPRDMGIATYGTVESFDISFGRRLGSTSNNFYGLAFKALPWGSSTPISFGASYTLSYNINGGTGTAPNDQTGNLNATITLEDEDGFERSGFTFVGWNTEANGSGTSYAANGSFAMPEGGDVLYAQWTPVLYVLSYNSNGGFGAPASSNLGSGTSTRISVDEPTRTGFTFLHWAENQDGSGATYSPFASFTMPANNTTLFAQWQVVTGTLNYSANGGNTTQSAETVTAGSSVIVASGDATSRSGFVFAGWNTQANGSGVDYLAGSSIVVPQGSTTLYAKWTAVRYAVNYVANGGTGVPAAGNGYADQDYTIPGTLPTRNGYTFSSWTTMADGSGSSYNPGQTLTLSASNLILYAQWTINSYSLSYDVNGGDAGTEPATQSEQAFSNATVSGTEPTRTLHRFNGWNTVADGSGTSYATGSSLVMPGSDLVLYAQWVSASFDVVYNANGGVGGPLPSSSSGQAEISVSSTLSTRVGYTFSAWALRSDGTGTTYNPGDNFPISTDVTFFAKWIALLFNLSYDVNGGETAAPATVNGLIVSQSTTVDSTVPSRSGYVFVGWGESVNASTRYLGGNSFQMPASDVTLYAIWSGVPYNLIYNTNGGNSGPADEVVQNGATVLIGSAPNRTGYVFGGWNTAPDGSGQTLGPNATFTMTASDVTFYAQWSKVTRSVTFDDNGGSSGPADVSGLYQDQVTIPLTTPERDGFNFTGWNTNCDGNGTPYQPGDVVTIGVSNLALCAQWAVVTYVLSYDANGGVNAPAGAALASGTVISASSVLPTRQGYTFASWNTAEDGSGTRLLAGGNFTMPAQATTLYAIWIANPYAIYFNSNGGSGVPAAQVANTGEQVTLSSTEPTRPGYTFIEWNEQSDGTSTAFSSSGSLTMPPNNLTLFAQWEFVRYTLTYDDNGGSGGPSDQSNLTVSQQVALSATEPNRLGFFFVGWNTQPDGSGSDFSAGSTLVMPAANLTLYANWVADTFNVVYNANGGSGAPAPEAYSTADTVTVAGAPTTAKPGHVFVEWSTTSSGVNSTYSPSDTFAMPPGGVTMFAQWTLSNVTITYDTNGGSTPAPSPLTVSFSEPIYLDQGTSFTKSGQTLIGWNTAANGSGIGYSLEQLIPAENLTLYAQWGDTFYALAYNAAGGTGTPQGVVTTAGQPVTVTTTLPNRTGFVFDEWSSVTGTPTYQPGATLVMPAQNVVLFATWQQPINTSGGSSGGEPPALPTVSPTVSPTLSPTVSPTVSPSVSDTISGESVAPTPIPPRPTAPVQPEIDYRVKDEVLDDSFEVWTSSDEVMTEEPVAEPEPTVTEPAQELSEELVTEAPAQEPDSAPLWWLAGIPVVGGLAWWLMARRRRD